MVHGPERVYMKLWWKKARHVTGLRIEKVSPYRQRILAPLAKDWINKAKHRVTDNWITAGIPLTFWFLVSQWCIYQNEQLHKQKWP